MLSTQDPVVPAAPPIPPAPPPPPPLPASAIPNTDSRGGGQKKTWATVQVSSGAGNDDSTGSSNTKASNPRASSSQSDAHSVALKQILEMKAKESKEKELATIRESTLRKVLNSEPITEKKDDYFLSQIQTYLNDQSVTFLKKIDEKISSINKIIPSIKNVFSNLALRKDKDAFKAVTDKNAATMELIKTQVGSESEVLAQARKLALSKIVTVANKIMETERCKKLIDSYKSKELKLEEDKSKLREETREKKTDSLQQIDLIDAVAAGEHELYSLLQSGMPELLLSEKSVIEGIVTDMIASQLSPIEQYLKNLLESLRREVSEVQALQKTKATEMKDQNAETAKKLDPRLLKIARAVISRSSENGSTNSNPLGYKQPTRLSEPPSSFKSRVLEQPTASSSDDVAPPVAAATMGSRDPSHSPKPPFAPPTAESVSTEVEPVSSQDPPAPAISSTPPADLASPSNGLSTTGPVMQAPTHPESSVDQRTLRPPVVTTVRQPSSASPKDLKQLVHPDQIQNVSFWWWLGFTDYTVSKEQREKLWSTSKPLTEDTAVEYWDLFAEHPEKARGLFSDEERLLLLSGLAKKLTTTPSTSEVKANQIKHLLRHLNQPLPGPITTLSAAAKSLVQDLIKNNYSALFDGCSTSALKFLFKVAGITKEFFTSADGQKNIYNFNKRLSWSEWWRGETPLAIFVQALPTMGSQGSELPHVKQDQEHSPQTQMSADQLESPQLLQSRNPIHDSKSAIAQDPPSSVSKAVGDNPKLAAVGEHSSAEGSTESEVNQSSLRPLPQALSSQITGSQWTLKKTKVGSNPNPRVVKGEKAPKTAQLQAKKEAEHAKIIANAARKKESKNVDQRDLLLSCLMARHAGVYGTSNIGGSDLPDHVDDSDDSIDDPSTAQRIATPVDTDSKKENSHKKPSTSTGTILMSTTSTTPTVPQTSIVRPTLSLDLAQQIKAFPHSKEKPQSQGDARDKSQDKENSRAQPSTCTRAILSSTASTPTPKQAQGDATDKSRDDEIATSRKKRKSRRKSKGPKNETSGLTLQSHQQDHIDRLVAARIEGDQPPNSEFTDPSPGKRCH